MNTAAIIDSFVEFKDDKNIDRITLMGLLEQSFRSLLIKQYGSDDSFDIVVNTNKGDLQIFHNKTIVKDGEVEDAHIEIALSDALQVESDFEVGEVCAIEKKIEDFGRRAIQTLKQNLISKVLEHDYELIHKSYKDRVDELVSGEVHHIRHKEIILMDENDIELILPRDDQISSDFFRKGDTVRAVIKEVLVNKGKPRIMISRTSPLFLERLFELEIPEISDGLIVIKKVKRVPGEKAKVAVESYDERIDPVGACVGMKGSRIHSIVRELGNENIDVINYTDNLKLFISRSLSPAKITTIQIDDENNKANVYLKPDQVSLAIGKGGYNIRLAGQLTGYEIDVYRDIDEDEDVALTEFADEIDEWIIEVFKSIGCDTAKSVLELGVEELSRRTDLEEETIIEVQNILRLEFE